MFYLKPECNLLNTEYFQPQDPIKTAIYSGFTLKPEYVKSQRFTIKGSHLADEDSTVPLIMFPYKGN
jgi:hypothetical protein